MHSLQSPAAPYPGVPAPLTPLQALRSPLSKPSVKILAEHTQDRVAVTAKQLTAVLDANKATIRQWRPRSNRRSVHLADWLKHIKSTEARGNNDDWASPTEAETRKLAIYPDRTHRE